MTVSNLYQRDALALHNDIEISYNSWSSILLATLLKGFIACHWCISTRAWLFESHHIIPDKELGGGTFFTCSSLEIYGNYTSRDYRSKWQDLPLALSYQSNQWKSRPSRSYSSLLYGRKNVLTFVNSSSVKVAWCFCPFHHGRQPSRSNFLQ